MTDEEKRFELVKAILPTIYQSFKEFRRENPSDVPERWIKDPLSSFDDMAREAWAIAEATLTAENRKYLKQ